MTDDEVMAIILGLVIGIFLAVMLYLPFIVPPEPAQGVSVSWSGPRLIGDDLGPALEAEPIDPEYVMEWVHRDDLRLEERVSELEAQATNWPKPDYEPLSYWAFLTDLDNGLKGLNVIYEEIAEDGSFRLMLMERTDYWGWCEPIVLYP